MKFCAHMHTYTCTCARTQSQPCTPSVYMVDCGAPQSTNVSVNYSSTLEGSILQFCCAEGFLPSDAYTAICHPNGSWVPDPTSYVCTVAATGKMYDTQ